MGAPQKLLTLKDDVVYALAVRNGSLLAATGNRGRVYRVDTKEPGRFTDVAHLEASQGMAFAPVKDGLLVATSNSGKVFRLGDAVAAECDVHERGVRRAGIRAVGAGGDAGGSCGRVRSVCAERECGESADGVERVGSSVGPDGAFAVPAGRFVQWKAVLRSGGSGRFGGVELSAEECGSGGG